ncbi:helix-turn-helix domain-containing protein [Piscinibacter gummiphilus]|uniref:Helix-turn-helix domain-containing protein n=1 Tax=Piscinibacter gummiphilus TaxID=946333 RepID=A0ABZ0CPS6_9BURK|nr:helix-turn-helix domain-containing protein [Piscinibacter gummiphilus]WOB06531.1 helix-turn-helix domain-containing protein [Piscinibacter gummiphilus]
MSIELMTLAWKTALATTPKMVLLVMCDRADEEGGSLWPSIEYISRRSSVSERQVQRTLRELEEIGLLAVTGNAAGGKPGMTRHYGIKVPALREMARQATGAKASPLAQTNTGDTVSPLPAEAGDKATPVNRPTGVILSPVRVTPATETGDTHVTQSTTDPSEEKKEITGKPKKPAKPVIPNLTLEELMADGLSEVVATEWLAHRLKSGGKLTPLAWGAIKKNVAAAGWSLDDAVTKAIYRGWQGIETAWLLRETNPRAGAPRQSSHDLSGKDYTAGVAKDGALA